MQLERNRFWLKKVIEQVQEEPENKASGMYQVRSLLGCQIQMFPQLFTGPKPCTDGPFAIHACASACTGW
jgi:hypothetical protein